MFSGIINTIYSFLNSPKIKLVIIDKNAIVPYKETTGAAGFSVYCPSEVIVPKGHRVLIPLGISIEIPDYHYIRVAPVNHLSMKGIDIGAGVINSSYTGEIKVMIINNSDSHYVIEDGDKIAQLIITRCNQSKLEIYCDYPNTESEYSESESESEIVNEEPLSEPESDELAEDVDSFDNTEYTEYFEDLKK